MYYNKEMISEYLKYIKHNPNGYWFKRKLYGWGWAPATREGWFVLATFVAFVFWLSADMTEKLEPTRAELLCFFAKLAGAIFVLILICYKTGEKPKWQWGIPKK